MDQSRIIRMHRFEDSAFLTFFNIFRIKRAIIAYYMVVVGRLKKINLNEERNIEMATKTPKIEIIASANGVFAYMALRQDYSE